MLEDAPQRSVTHNGVTFHVGDLEALMIAAYNRAPADMIGGRCNDGTMDEPVMRDEQGRPIDVECRDSNPGAFHVIMTNFLGLQQRPYAEDRTYDYEVWNQPVVAFRVSKLEEITVARANELLGLTGDTYSFNADAAKLYEVEATSTYITESHASTTPADPSRYERMDRYTYILEVDSRGKIIGGEWFGASRTNHPDFLWNPRRLTRSSVPSLDINQIRMLIAMSREAPGGGGGTGGTAREFAGMGGIAIPDNNTTGVTSTANVADAIGIGGIQVALDITHTYVGDLKITLTHAGTERTIWNNEGGSDDNINTTLNVSGFSGDASGDWVLKVVDSAGQDVGRINGWRLLVTPSGTTIGGGTGGTAGTFPGDASGTAIPDNSTTGIRSTANVPAGTSGTVTVSVNLTHPYVGDLIVKLTHGSQTWTLHNRAGGSADNIVRTFALDPAPSGDLSGAWTLQVQDRAAEDVGTLNSWSLVVAR
jgi:subtilisin-like proprotein convertase family protein